VSNAAVDAAGAEDERFSGTSGRLIGWVGVATALAIVGTAIAGGNPVGDRKAVYFAVALAAVSWVVLIRPSVSSSADGVLLRNMLRDAFVPWSRIERCRVVQTVQIVTEDGRHFHGLGVSRSARSMVNKSYGRRWLLPGMMLGGVGGQASRQSPVAPSGQRVREGMAYQDYVEHTLSVRARESSADDLEPVVAWSSPSVAASAVAAVLLVLLIFT
jgi:hypothetical protein